jgi:hypothetical protein
MKRSKFSDEQILAIVKEGEAGRKVSDLCRADGITVQLAVLAFPAIKGMLAMQVRAVRWPFGRRSLPVGIPRICSSLNRPRRIGPSEHLIGSRVGSKWQPLNGIPGS